MFLMGLLLTFCAYKIYENGEKQALVQKNSPVIMLPVTGRTKGSGTLRMPNKIYVMYQGNQYQLLSPNKHFRKTAKADSIEVNFDAAQGIAVLRDIEVTGPYPLLAIIFLAGLFLMVYAFVDFIKISAH